MKKIKRRKQRIRVAVLCGGPGSEREVSLKSGAQIAANLPRGKYSPKLIDLPPAALMAFFDQLKKFDLVWNALHGKFGEDGGVQAILDVLEVSYTGSGVLASALGMNKIKTNEIARAAGLLIPKTALLKSARTKETARALREIGLPCVVKPNASGSSVGVSIVRQKKDFLPALRKAFREDSAALVQKYIEGQEVTCGVLGNFGGKLKALPPILIVAHADFFDYEAKYNSRLTEEICPAPLPKKLIAAIEDQAVRIHAALGADGLTRSDFILARGKLYFLEINTSPGMTAASLCPKETKALGWTFPEFLDRIAQLALDPPPFG